MSRPDLWWWNAARVEIDHRARDARLRLEHLERLSFGQVHRVVNKPGIPKMARLSPHLKYCLIASAAAAMLAFAVGLLVAVSRAWADERTRPRPTAERAGTDVVRAQPTAKQFAPPNQPEVSDRDSIYVDELYRQLIGPSSATSSGSRLITRLQPAPKR
jgi:hypothetical protein